MAKPPRHDPTGALGRATEAAPEPEPPQPIEAPEEITTRPRALLAWNNAVATLRETHGNDIPASFLDQLARYASMSADHAELSEHIQATGLIVSDRFDIPGPNKAIAARDAVERSIRNLEKALGLDPASRADAQRDLHRLAKDKNTRGTSKRVGGFLNKKKAGS